MTCISTTTTTNEIIIKAPVVPEYCRTVFCKGFPNTMTKENLLDMFSRLIGGVDGIRINFGSSTSTNTYCHVR